MSEFKAIAKVVKDGRLKEKLSQNALAVELGYRNAQFISNVERSLCSIPLKKIKALSELIDVKESTITDAMVADYKSRVEHWAQK